MRSAWPYSAAARTISAVFSASCASRQVSIDSFTWNPPMTRPTRTGTRRMAFSRVGTRQLRGEPAGVATGHRRIGRIGGRRRGARRRGEVTPLLLRRGARVVSPHSTNNLSASAPTVCRVLFRAVLLGSSSNSSTGTGRVPNSRNLSFRVAQASDKTGIKNEPRQKAGLVCAQWHHSDASGVDRGAILCRNVMNTGADRVKGHSPPPPDYGNYRVAIPTCAYLSRAMSACSTSVISALFASARWRASVVRIGVSGPIWRASRTSSGV